MSSSNRSAEMFWRIILIAAMLIQYLAMPFAARAETTTPPLFTYYQQRGETDSAYLQRLGTTDPELVQQATLAAVQDALNGRVTEFGMERATIGYINDALEMARSDWRAVSVPEASVAETAADEAYNLSLPTYDESGERNGGFEITSDPVRFEQLRAAQNAAIAQLEGESAEPAVIDQIQERYQAPLATEEPREMVESQRSLANATTRDETTDTPRTVVNAADVSHLDFSAEQILGTYTAPDHDTLEPFGLLDVNGDGLVDIVYHPTGVTGVRWLEQRSDGGWLPHGDLFDRDDFPEPNSSGNIINTGYVDINDDGRPDVVVLVQYGNHLRLYAMLHGGRADSWTQELLGTFDNQPHNDNAPARDKYRVVDDGHGIYEQPPSSAAYDKELVLYTEAQRGSYFPYISTGGLKLTWSRSAATQTWSETDWWVDESNFSFGSERIVPKEKAGDIDRSCGTGEMSGSLYQNDPFFARLMEPGLETGEYTATFANSGMHVRGFGDIDGDGDIDAVRYRNLTGFTVISNDSTQRSTTDGWMPPTATLTTTVNLSQPSALRQALYEIYMHAGSRCNLTLDQLSIAFLDLYGNDLSDAAWQSLRAAIDAIEVWEGDQLIAAIPVTTADSLPQLRLRPEGHAVSGQTTRTSAVTADPLERTFQIAVRYDPEKLAGQPLYRARVLTKAHQSRAKQDWAIASFPFEATETDVTFSPWLPIEGLANEVNVVAVAANGSVYAAGAGTDAVVQYDPVDGKWNALTGLNGVVNALHISADQTLYAGGDFGIAIWDGAAWSVSDIGGTVNTVTSHEATIYAAGEGIGVKQLVGPNWTAVGTDSPTGSVYALAVYDGELYAGGAFTPDYIARWDGTSWDGLSDDNFGTLNDTVYALAVFGNQLMIGGAFSVYTTDTTFGFVAWDGQEFQALDGVTGGSEQVRALAVYDNYLAVGGDFAHVGLAAQQTQADDIAIWNGSSWQSYLGGVGEAGGKVSTVAMLADGLWAGGSFNEIGGRTSSNIGRYQPDLVDVSATLLQPASAEWPATVAITLTATNALTTTVNGVRLIDQLPAGFSYQSSDGDCAAVGQTVTCNAPSLAGGESHTVTLQIGVLEAGTQPVTNTVRALSLYALDATPVDNSAQGQIALSIDPNVMIDLSVSVSGEDAVQAGEIATYTLTIDNTGAVTSTVASVTIGLPEGSSYNNNVPSCTQNFETLTCTIGEIEPDQPQQLELPLTMNGFGPVQLTAAVTHSTIGGTLYENDDSDNSASITTFVQSDSRAALDVGRVVIEANSFALDGASQMTASGAVYLGYRNDDNSVTNHFKLTGGADQLTWDRADVTTTIDGSGTLAHFVSEQPLLSGTFSISDLASSPTIDAQTATPRLTQLGRYAINGDAIIQSVSLISGAVTLSAAIAFTAPGIAMPLDANVTVQPDGSFSGTTQDAAVQIGSLTVTPINPRLDQNGLTAAQMTIQLPAQLGGGSGSAENFVLTRNRITIGGVGVGVPLPDITLASGSVLGISDVTASITFGGGAFFVGGSGTLNIALPDNGQALPIDFVIDPTGRLTSRVDELILDLASVTLRAEHLSLTNGKLFASAATITLPQSLGSRVNTVQNVTIDDGGLSFGSGQPTFNLPSHRLGTNATFFNLTAQLVIENNRAAQSYRLSVDGSALISAADNFAPVTFTGAIADGELTGTLGTFNLKLSGSRLTVSDMAYANNRLFTATGSLRLPESLNNTVVPVPNVELLPSGMNINNNDPISLPTVDAGHQSSVGGLQLIDSSLAFDGKKFDIDGDFRINLSGQTTVARTISLDMDSFGRINALLFDFSIGIVGLELTVDNARIENGVLRIDEAGFAMPKGLGGAAAAVYDVTIGGRSGFSIGGGKFALPKIKISDQEFIALSAEIKRDEDDDSVLLITAAGKFTVKHLEADGPGCFGISVSLTIAYDTSRGMVIDVETTETADSASDAPATRSTRASASLRNVTVAAHCTIPIGTTGLQITKIGGSLTLKGDSTRVEFFVEIETKLDVLGEPALASEPTVGIESGRNPNYWQLDFAAAVTVFSMITVAEIEAGVRIGQKEPGGADGIVTAQLIIDMRLVRGELFFTAWTQAGNFHMVGGASIRLGVPRGLIMDACVAGVCVTVPKRDYFLTTKLEFGEFNHKGDVKWGGKFSALGKGIFISSEGDFKIFGTKHIKLIDAPSLRRAVTLHDQLARGQLSRTALAAEDVALMNTYRVVDNAVTVDFEVPVATHITVIAAAARSDENLEFRLVRPDGLEITLDNLPANIEAQVDINESTSPDEVDAVQTVFDLYEVTPGTWQIKLLGASEAENGFFVDIRGYAQAAALKQLSLQQTGETTATVNWSMTAAVPTTTVNIYATQGPITYTQTITDADGITTTQVAEQFSGAPIVVDAPTTTDGTPASATFDFSGWESGEYYIWVEASNPDTMPTRKYVPGNLVIQHPWQETWTANMQVTSGYRELTVSWDQHPSEDVDFYEVMVVPEGGDFLSAETITADVGQVLSTIVSDLEPNTAYTIKVVGGDYDTANRSDSETAVGTAAGASFSIGATPSSVVAQGGQSVHATLTLSTTVDPLPVPVVLRVADAPFDIAADILTDAVTPTLGSEVTAQIVITPSELLASGTQTVTVRASAAGEVQHIEIPVTIQQPEFALRVSEETLTLTKDGAVSVDVDAVYQFGETDDVLVSADGIPAGAISDVTNDLFSVGEKATLTITDTELLQNGSYTITLTGEDAQQTRTQTVRLVVDKPSFGLNTIGSSRAQALHGQTVTYTVDLVGTNWSDPVAFGFDPLRLSDYFTPTLAVTETTVPATFAVVVELPSDTPAGEYEFVLQGVSADITETVSLELIVAPETSQPDLAVDYVLSAEELSAGELLTVTTRYENRGVAPIDFDSIAGITRTLTADEPLLIPVTVADCADLVPGSDVNGFNGTYRCNAPAATQLAGHTPVVYLLSSGSSAAAAANDQVIANALTARGMDVTVGVEWSDWNGTQIDLSMVDVVVFLNSYNWNGSDMPLAGQNALIDFVNGGGGLITAGSVGYNTRDSNSDLRVLRDVLPFTYTGWTTDPVFTYTVKTADSTVGAGLPDTFTFAAEDIEGTNEWLLAKDGATSFYTIDPRTNSGVVGWQYGAGRIASFSTMLGVTEFGNDNFATLFGNTVGWSGRLYHLAPGEVVTRTTVYRAYEGASDGAVATIGEALNVINAFDPTEDGWSADILVRNTSDLSVTLATSAASVNAGETVSYTATVRTNGNAPATGVELSIAPDAWLSLGTFSDGCVVVNGALSCEIGRIESGCQRATAADSFVCGVAPSAEITLTATVDPAATQAVATTVMATSAVTDPNKGNNETAITIDVTTLAELQHTLTAIVEESAEGGTHEHRLVITNSGPSVARNIIVSHTLPADAYYLALTHNGRSLDLPTASQLLRVAQLAPSESLTLTMQIVHLQDTGGAWLTSNLRYRADGVAEQSLTVRRNVTNNAPSVTLVAAPEMVREGSQILLSVIATDTAPLDMASPAWSVDWDLDGDGQYDDKTGNVATFDAAALDGAGATRGLHDRMIGVRVTDGVEETTQTHTFVIGNVAPTVDAGDDQRKAVIDTFTLDATFTDPAAVDTHTAVVKWGDGTQENATITDGVVSATHSYSEVGNYDAEVCVIDDDGGEGCDSVQLRASCLDHGLVTSGLSYHFDNRTLIATTNLNYLGTYLPNPLPEGIDLTLYNGETAVDTINVKNAFATEFSQAVSFEWEMAPLDTYTLTVAIDDDGMGNKPLSLCVSGKPNMETNTAVAPQDAPDVGESRIYGPTGVTIGRTGGDDPGMITVTRSETDHADADYVDLMWSIEAEDEEGLELDLEVCYADGDLSADQQANEARLILYHRHEPTDAWDALVSTVNTDVNCIEAHVSQLSDFIIGLADPNAITLESFTATKTEDGTVMLDWMTSAEFDHAGFNVYRADSNQFVNAVTLNAQIIPSNGIQGQGGRYALEDTTTEAGIWFYWLEDIDIYGERTLHGPVEINMSSPTAVTVSQVSLTLVTAQVVMMLAMLLVGLTAVNIRRAASKRQRKTS